LGNVLGLIFSPIRKIKRSFLLLFIFRFDIFPHTLTKNIKKRNAESCWKIQEYLNTIIVAAAHRIIILKAFITNINDTTAPMDR
jgi:hypothetical protein